MTSRLRRFAAANFAAIDEEYRRPDAPAWHAYAVLVTAAVSLVVQRFFGTRKFFDESGLDTLLAGAPLGRIHGWLFWSGFKFVSYFLLPALCVALVTRRRVVEHGLSLRAHGRVWLLYLAMAVAMLPVVYAVSFTDAFARKYPKYEFAHASLLDFFVWELAYGVQFFLLEYFFRGFLLHGLARQLGSTAIFVAVVPYAMIHFDKPLAEALGSIFSGIVLGTIALRTGSIYGGVAVHCTVAWSMDVCALARQGKLGGLFGG